MAKTYLDIIPCNRFVLVIQGTVEVKGNDQHISLQENQYAYFPPGAEARYTLESVSSCCALVSPSLLYGYVQCKLYIYNKNHYYFYN